MKCLTLMKMSLQKMRYEEDWRKRLGQNTNNTHANTEKVEKVRQPVRRVDKPKTQTQTQNHSEAKGEAV